MTIIQFKKMYPNQIIPWLIERSTASGKRLPASSARLLIEFLGDNLFKLSSALRKVSDAVPSGAAITEDHVRRLIAGDKDANYFELSDAILSGDVRKTIPGIGFAP